MKMHLKIPNQLNFFAITNKKSQRDLNEIINKDVPTATFIFNPYNKIKDGTIKNPPPAPTNL